MGTADSSKRIGPEVVVAAGAISLLAFAYMVYASKGWFHQDDFIFIAKFSDHLAFSDLFGFDGFGRFLTQNVYWHVGLDVLGRNSELFYFFNASTVAATSCVVYLLARTTVGPPAALVAALLYFASPRVVHAYAWISNSQHLIAHFLCFGFLFLLLRGRDQGITFRQSTALLAVFALALVSNSFSIALLAPVIWQGMDRDLRSLSSYRFLVVGAAAMSLIAFIRARNSAEGAYEVSISFEVLRTNAEAYFADMTRFAVWIFGSLAAALLLARRRRMVESTMFMSSIAFFVPFAFLTTQRFPQYGAMSLALLLVGTWMVVHPRVSVWKGSFGPALSIVATIYFSVQGLQEFSSRLAEPLGERAHHLVEDFRGELRRADPSITRYCFDHDPVLDTEGNVTTSDPPVWWWVGHGSAFSLFVDASKTYELSSRSDDCEATLFISADSISGVEEERVQKR